MNRSGNCGGMMRERSPAVQQGILRRMSGTRSSLLRFHFVVLTAAIAHLLECSMSSKLAEKIITLPKLYEAGDRSTACLLKDVGFPERDRSLSVEEVETLLKR